MIGVRNRNQDPGPGSDQEHAPVWRNCAWNLKPFGYLVYIWEKEEYNQHFDCLLFSNYIIKSGNPQKCCSDDLTWPTAHAFAICADCSASTQNFPAHCSWLDWLSLWRSNFWQFSANKFDFVWTKSTKSWNVTAAARTCKIAHVLSAVVELSVFPRAI